MYAVETVCRMPGGAEILRGSQFLGAEKRDGGAISGQVAISFV